MSAVELTVLKPGIGTTLQDAGRLGYEQYGVAQSGAFDIQSWRLANQLVGNDTSQPTGGPAALEVLLGDISIRAENQATIAIAGANPSFRILRDGNIREIAAPAAVRLTPGDVVELERTRTGLRSYLAIAGGFEAPAVLGSRSWDSTAQLGTPPLAPGDILTALTSKASDVSTRITTANLLDNSPLKMFPGPHAAVVHNAFEAITNASWKVTPDISRAGMRLASDETISVPPATTPSVPTLPGTVQLLPNGQLIIFGPDGPVTGGYLFVGFLVDEQLSQLSQRRPGEVVRFDLAVTAPHFS